MDVKSGTLRILGRQAGDLEAHGPDDRRSLVDQAIAQHDERRTIALRFEPEAERPYPHGRRGHLIVGIHGETGAAVLHKIRDPEIGDFVITATSGENSSTTPSPVPLDDSAGMYFLTNRVVPKDRLRDAMIEYALTGSVTQAVTMTPFDWHEDHWQTDFPDEIPTGYAWPASGKPFTGEPPF